MWNAISNSNVYIFQMLFEKKWFLSIIYSLNVLSNLHDALCQSLCSRYVFTNFPFFFHDQFNRYGKWIIIIIIMY